MFRIDLGAFKTGLLAATALVVVPLLSAPAAAQSGEFAQSAAPNAPVELDANSEFLCNYGHFTVSAYRYYGGSSEDRISDWSEVAVPITGHGQTIHSITVEMEPGAYPGKPRFHAGIYSNTSSGFPGNRIAGDTGKAPAQCGPVTIFIQPTTLQPNTAYWVEERIRLPFPQFSAHPESDDVGWAIDPRTKRKAYVRSHKYFSCYPSSVCRGSSSTTPWRQQPTGPYVRLR